MNPPIDHPPHATPTAGAERLVDRLADFLARVSPQGDICFVSRAGALCLGYPEDYFGGHHSLLSIVVEEDHGLLVEGLGRAENGERQGLDLHMLRQDGRRVWMTCRLLPLSAGGKHTELLFAAWEVGERPLPPGGDEAADPLTGLPTRAQLLQELQELTRPAPGRAGGFALLHLDLDGFQKVNDALGHASGDRLLVEAASRLSSLLRTSDRVARFGSDEFAMILSGTHEREAVHQVARKILTAMARPYHLGDRHLHLTASIGIALYPEHASDGGQLLKHADIALTSAKAGGRNRCLFYRSGGVEEASRQVSLEEHMYEAIQNGEFEMHYQPICRPDTRELMSVEALMRWHRPGEGFVPPVEFIPLAERNGLIGFLGAWSLRASCHQVARWNATWGVGMGASVNLSPVQFHQGDIVDMVRKALDESGLPPHLLTLEITEGALMQDPAETEALLNRLRALGVGVSVDDFGTGYSSLAYLKRFPLSSFKIDRSFVAELDGDGNDLAIVSVLIDLARVLDLSVVAEGVETEAQLHMLAEKGCKLLQGYLLGRPVSAQDLTGKVESGEWKVGQ